MSVYTGISLSSSLALCPHKYELALSEITDFIENTNFALTVTEHILTITNKYQQFRLPLKSEYLFTHLQYILITSEEDEEFLEAVVESLIILKEYFPHQVMLELVSELEQVENLREYVEEEIPRRLIGRAKGMMEDGKMGRLGLEDVEMLVFNLEAEFHKDYKQKLKAISVKILTDSKIDSKIWPMLSKGSFKIIDDLANDQIFQKQGIEILEKIIRGNPQQFVFPEDENENPNISIQQEVKQSFGCPLDPMTALFQLKESVNLCRICWIIDNIDLNTLSEKNLKKFDLRIESVVNKLFNSEISYSSTDINLFIRSLKGYSEKRTNADFGAIITKISTWIAKKSKEDKEEWKEKSNSRIYNV